MSQGDKIPWEPGITPNLPGSVYRSLQGAAESNDWTTGAWGPGSQGFLRHNYLAYLVRKDPHGTRGSKGEIPAFPPLKGRGWTRGELSSRF